MTDNAQTQVIIDMLTRMQNEYVTQSDLEEHTAQVLNAANASARAHVDNLRQEFSLRLDRHDVQIDSQSERINANHRSAQSQMDTIKSSVDTLTQNLNAFSVRFDEYVNTRHDEIAATNERINDNAQMIRAIDSAISELRVMEADTSARSGEALNYASTQIKSANSALTRIDERIDNIEVRVGKMVTVGEAFTMLHSTWAGRVFTAAFLAVGGVLNWNDITAFVHSIFGG
jgi:chaperonin cofactor prefoldin